VIRQRVHDEIVTGFKDRIVFLEAELARARSENRDLVNAMATQARAPQPFRVPVSISDKPKVKIPGRKGVFQKERELEAANRRLES
jgi:hypothetical protein